MTPLKRKEDLGVHSTAFLLAVTLSLPRNLSSQKYFLAISVPDLSGFSFRKKNKIQYRKDSKEALGNNLGQQFYTSPPSQDTQKPNLLYDWFSLSLPLQGAWIWRLNPSAHQGMYWPWVQSTWKRQEQADNRISQPFKIRSCNRMAGHLVLTTALPILRKWPTQGHWNCKSHEFLHERPFHFINRQGKKGRVSHLHVMSSGSDSGYKLWGQSVSLAPSLQREGQHSSSSHCWPAFRQPQPLNCEGKRASYFTLPCSASFLKRLLLLAWEPQVSTWEIYLGSVKRGLQYARNTL